MFYFNLESWKLNAVEEKIDNIMVAIFHSALLVTIVQKYIFDCTPKYIFSCTVATIFVELDAVHSYGPHLLILLCSPCVNWIRIAVVHCR